MMEGTIPTETDGQKSGTKSGTRRRWTAKKSGMKRNQSCALKYECPFIHSKIQNMSKALDEWHCKSGIKSGPKKAA